MATPRVPVIDIAPLVRLVRSAGQPLGAGVAEAADRVAAACEDVGFLQLVGHGADAGLLAALRDAAEVFFALDVEEKQRIAMRRGGRAWRGWFGVGDELTSGAPDHKEGLYLGTEAGPDSAAVRAGIPLHGANLFPEHPAELGPLAMRWMAAMVEVGRAVLSGVAISAGLEPNWFDRWCAEPTVLFRIFHYPPQSIGSDPAWGVAEHTDYGLLTVLAQDHTGGLQVRVDDRWVDVAPSPDTLVCNLGDMMELVSSGRFRSTPHRVLAPTSSHRYSFPVFLDPAWNARMSAIPDAIGAGSRRAEVDHLPSRWDGSDPTAFEGLYGEYLFDKVSRVFPDVFAELFDDDRGSDAANGGQA